MSSPHITTLEMADVDRLFQSEPGYVLSFSDASFATFFAEEVGIDIDDQRYHADGRSKMRRLRCFLRITDAPTAVKALRALLAVRADLYARARQQDPETFALGKIENLIGRQQQLAPSTDGIDRFSEDATLEELVAAIERDIAANKHQAALDRLHTYCMKKFAHLLRLHGEEPRAGESLNARARRYFNPLRRAGQRPITDKIMKLFVEVLELFNDVRNNASLAHDSTLVSPAEARFIFDGITTFLRFARAIEGTAFESRSKAV